VEDKNLSLDLASYTTVQHDVDSLKTVITDNALPFPPQYCSASQKLLLVLEVTTPYIYF